MNTQINSSLISLPSQTPCGVLSSLPGARNWPGSSMLCLHSKLSSFPHIGIHLCHCLLLTKLSKLSVWHNYTTIPMEYCRTSSLRTLAQLSKSRFLFPIRDPGHYSSSLFERDYETFREQGTHWRRLKR